MWRSLQKRELFTAAARHKLQYKLPKFLLFLNYIPLQFIALYQKKAERKDEKKKKRQPKPLQPSSQQGEVCVQK